MDRKALIDQGTFSPSASISLIRDNPKSTSVDVTKAVLPLGRTLWYFFM
jgi:hypothetical protein